MDTSIEYGSDERAPSRDGDEGKLGKPSQQQQARRLAETLALVREQQEAKQAHEGNAKNAQRKELSILLDNLENVIAELGDDRQYFDFYLTDNHVPQLYIDRSTFVVAAKGGEDFRLLKETRAGRILLHETRDREAMGEAIVHYVAERLSHIDNERAQATRVASSYKNDYAMGHEGMRENAMMQAEPKIIVRGSRLRSFFWFLIGFLTGGITLFALAWFRADISALLSSA